MRNQEIPWDFIAPMGLLLLIGVLWAGSSLVEDRIIKGYNNALMDGKEYERPGWIRWFYRLKFPVITLCCISILFIDRLPLLMDGMIWPLFTIILNMGIFASGSVLYGSGTSPRLGKFLMMLAAWLELMIGHIARSWDIWSKIL